MFADAPPETVAFRVSDWLCCDIEGHNPRICRRYSAERREQEERAISASCVAVQAVCCERVSARRRGRRCVLRVFRGLFV